jgi:hypothetical protein
MPWNPYTRERLSTVELLIEIGCFVYKENIVSISKVANLN